MQAATARIDAAAGERRTKLKRAIGPGTLTLFILGDILGAGIYALVGEVSAEVGGAIWAPFAAAFVLAVLTAFAYAELVTKYPRAGGSAYYTHRAFGRQAVTFLVAFAIMASGIASASTLSRAFAGDYLKQFLDLPLVGVAIAFVLVVAAINLRGISESVKVNVALTLVEAAGLLLIVAIGIAALADGSAEVSRNLELREGESVFFVIVGGTALAFYSMIGFEDSVNVAEETRRPSRVYPRALFTGLGIAGLLYLLVTLTASAVVPTGALSGSSAPLLEVVERGPIAVDTDLFSLIALMAVANSALINMIMASRIVYGMADQGIVAGVLGRVLPNRRTPWAAIAFTTVIAVVLIATGDLSTLADTTVLLLLTVFTIVNVAVLMLRRDRVEHAHFTAPSALPALGALVSLALIVDSVVDEPASVLRALALLGVGLVLWLVNHLLGGGRKRELEAERLDG